MQSDNTAAQAKSQYVTLVVARLVHKGLFDTATLSCGRVGHTHEDIGQLFSVVVTLSFMCHHHEVPSEFRTVVEKGDRDTNRFRSVLPPDNRTPSRKSE